MELSWCCEIESMELCKLPGGERKVVCGFSFAIHIEATRMALLTFVSVRRQSCLGIAVSVTY